MEKCSVSALIKNLYLTDLRFVSLLTAPHGQSAEKTVQFRVGILALDTPEHVDQLLHVLRLLGERG